MFLFLFAFSLLPLAHTQDSPPVAVPRLVAQLPHPPRQPQEGEPRDEGRARLEREQEKKLNQERFANLKRDTDKLLQLATELKENVDKANEHTLSLDVLKKAEEIEKLAKNVKEKMRGY